MNKILNFHFVNDSNWFERVVYLLKSKYELVNIERINEFYQGNTQLKNACHITVDDGDISFYDIIYPVLKKHKVPATLFVSPKICSEKTNYWFQEIEGCDPVILKQIVANKVGVSTDSLSKFSMESILKSFTIAEIHAIINHYQSITKTAKKNFRNMSIDMLREVDRSGLVSVGAHTMNHPILKNEDDLSSQFETMHSVKALSSTLNREVKYFAYPNGIPNVDFSEREETYLKKAGVHLAFSTESKNFSYSDNTMRIPRIGVSNVESAFLIKAKLLTGASWEKLKKLKVTGEYKQRRQITTLFN